MSIVLPKYPTAPDIEEIIKNDPLGEFFVWWKDLPLRYENDFEKCLSSAKSENELQKYLSSNPYVLAVQLGGGHGRWVIPKKRLGAEHVPDFMVAEKSSVGFEWYAVELESPHVKMFTKSGNPTHQLTHAIRQIQDWRVWLEHNRNYASRPRKESGLGLTDITANVDALILIGRQADINDSSNNLRRRMIKETRIKIHSYDWLLGAGGLTNLPKRTYGEEQ